MKYFKLAILFFILTFSVNVFAVTKDDIIALTDKIQICSNETSSLIKGFKNSYIRMLNERNVSDENLTIIYNNINEVINILNNYDVCSTEDKDKIPSSVQDDLYDLYNQTNNIIISSPKLGESNNDVKTTTKNDTNIVIDKNNKEIKIYDNGTLSDVIKATKKLNYVGINKYVIGVIILLSISLFLLLILCIFKINRFLNTSLIYCNILLLLIMFGFRNQISKGIDIISLMSVKENINEKQAVINNKQIVSYPSYGTNYGKIKINDQIELLYFGDSTDILKKGIGTSSVYAIPGDNKKVVLSGHNTGVFSNLSNLKKNNKLRIETTYATFDYLVKETEIVNDNNLESLEKDYDLILYTCYPNEDLYGSKRLIVYASLDKTNWLGE